MNASEGHTPVLYRLKQRRACARYAAHFLAVNGVGVLTSVLALARPPFQVIRYALAALEAVTRACGPAGCDVCCSLLQTPLYTLYWLTFTEGCTPQTIHTIATQTDAEWALIAFDCALVQVAMGWWCPPLPASWSPPPKDVKANGVMPKRSSKEQVLRSRRMPLVVWLQVYVAFLSCKLEGLSPAVNC